MSVRTHRIYPLVKEAALRLRGSSPQEGVQPRTTRFDDGPAVQGLQTLWMLSADTPRFDQ